MGPRLGRVEYAGAGTVTLTTLTSFNGATLRTRGIRRVQPLPSPGDPASMGPRLGRVEYASGLSQLAAKEIMLQWGHA